MENQHRAIKGYRELSQTEIDLMNRVKSLGPVLQELIYDLNIHVRNQRDSCNALPSDERVDEEKRLNEATPERWIAEGKTDLQKGLMSLTRSIAQPTFF